MELKWWSPSSCLSCATLLQTGLIGLCIRCNAVILRSSFASFLCWISSVTCRLCSFFLVYSVLWWKALLRKWAWELSFLRYYVCENVIIPPSYLGVVLKVENHFYSNVEVSQYSIVFLFPIYVLRIQSYPDSWFFVANLVFFLLFRSWWNTLSMPFDSWINSFCFLFLGLLLLRCWISWPNPLKKFIFLFSFFVIMLYYLGDFFNFIVQLFF